MFLGMTAVAGTGTTASCAASCFATTGVQSRFRLSGKNFDFCTVALSSTRGRIRASSERYGIDELYRIVE